jgi:hypothetical protein
VPVQQFGGQNDLIDHVHNTVAGSDVDTDDFRPLIVFVPTTFLIDLRTDANGTRFF